MPSADTPRAIHRRSDSPSLRKRLLGFLVLPMMLSVLISSMLFYLVALAYTDKVHDSDLDEDVSGMIHMLQGKYSDGSVSPQAQVLIEYSPEGGNYFSVRSQRHGLISSSAAAIPLATPAELKTSAEFYDTTIGQVPVRAATLTIPSPVDPTDTLTVTMAETLHGRQQRAREILLLMIPIELLLSGLLLVLAWYGVQYGLRILAPLTQRLAQRGPDLTPITAADVPVEILPLTRTIDGLFQRLQLLIDSQERFVTDAAHQLRTPLAGLMLHAEQATSATRAEDRDASLRHIRDLSKRVARASSQLLAMARAQTAEADHAPLDAIDLDQFLRELLGARVRDAISAGVDLGYEGTNVPILVAAEPNALQEAIDNLLDNALRHARHPNGKVTVTLAAVEDDKLRLSVDDNGSGVTPALRTRLGERFFRTPDAVAGGTGLGLAITRTIVDRHGGHLNFTDSPLGGLCVEIVLSQAQTP